MVLLVFKNTYKPKKEWEKKKRARCKKKRFRPLWTKVTLGDPPVVSLRSFTPFLWRGHTIRLDRTE